MIARARLIPLLLVALIAAAIPALPPAIAQNFGNIPPQTVLGNPDTTAKKPAQPFNWGLLSSGSGNILINPAMEHSQKFAGSAASVPWGNSDVCSGSSITQVVDSWSVSTGFNIAQSGTVNTHSSTTIDGISFDAIKYMAYGTYIKIAGDPTPYYTVQAVNTASSVTVSPQVVGTQTGVAITTGGGCNTSFIQYPQNPPTMFAEQIPVTDLPGVNKALELNFLTHGSNNSPLANINIYQNIAIVDMAFLGEGTPQAQTVTLGIWIKSTAAGNAGISLQSRNGIRQFFGMCALPANQWKQCTLTVPGDTKTTDTACGVDPPTPLRTTWPLDPVTAGQITGMVAAVALHTGTSYQGTGGIWECTASADSTQTFFGSIADLTKIAVAKAQLYPGATLPPFTMLSSAQELRRAEAMYVKSYEARTPLATLTQLGQDFIVGYVYGGKNVPFGEMYCPTPAINLFSPETGVSGKVSDLINNADVIPTIGNVSSKGFQWFASPSAGQQTVLGGHHTAECEG